MELELQADLLEYISAMTPFKKEVMHEYFVRVHTFSGTDEFGNALEEIPVSTLVSSTFNENVLVQAVSEAARIYRDFKEISAIQISSFQQFTIGKPYIKDGLLYNAYSLPVRELLGLFTDSLKEKFIRPILHLGKNHEFYLEGRPHDVLYQLSGRSLPKLVAQLLYENYRMKPLSSGAIIKNIVYKRKLSAQDITGAISDINVAFKKSSQLDASLIININKSGYFFNDRYFQIVID